MSSQSKSLLIATCSRERKEITATGSKSKARTFENWEHKRENYDARKNTSKLGIWTDCFNVGHDYFSLLFRYSSFEQSSQLLRRLGEIELAEPTELAEVIELAELN